MDDNTVKSFDLELITYRLSEANHKLFVLCMTLALMFFLAVGWIIFRENQFTTSTITIEAEQETSGEGNNYFIGGDYGETESKGN